MNFIPVSQPKIGDREKAYVNQALDSGWVSSLGVFIERLEEEFSRYIGVKHTIAVSNGTVAIHLALAALGIKPGDEVIIPDLTFVATANAVAYCGAVPVLADVDPVSLCLTAETIKAKLTSRTKAIIPVHLYGQPAEMDAIKRLADEHHLWVVEDVAEAHGAAWKGKKVGSWGHCGTFSLYGNKIITTGEGGLITTDDEALAQRLRFLRDHGMSKDKRYWHTELAYNYRITNLQAALGVAQLEQIDQFLSRRKEILGLYQKELKGLPGVTLNPQVPGGESVCWLVCLRHDNWTETSRAQFMQKLKEKGVDSRPFFYPLSQMPIYEQDRKLTPVSNAVYEKGINLPTYIDLTDDQIKTVSRCVRELLA
ncbi:MAG: DegT/DnrJ/EryC1/StrS aminotransferase family protein [Spirochaetales bacterium]|nr:DegT/DnrJ/EryC1/StrS aminotransferase family protein [Spirochaetales bacterium]